MERLINAFGWLLLAAYVCFYKEVHQAFLAHAWAPWAAMGVMLVLMFRQAYQNELEKRNRQGCR